MSISDKIIKSTKISFGIVDILTFIEGKNFLNMKLFPVQKFLFKMIYNIPLSNDISDNPIILKDRYNEHIIKTFNSESDFLEYLYIEENFPSKQYGINSISFDYPISEIRFIIGRRGTKTAMSAMIASYYLYQILSMEDPHEYFNILRSTEIGISLVSNHAKNANKLNREIVSMVYGSKFFSPFIISSDPASDGFSLRTKKHLADKSCKDGIVRVSTYAVSPSVRGPSNIVFIADEYAHFIDANASTKEKPLDRVLYDAIVPSVSGFVGPDSGQFGKSIFITSPNGKKGDTWDSYNSNRNSTDTIIVRIPSWWINPNISSDLLKRFDKKSSLSFDQEFGAVFVEGVSSWVRNQFKLELCRDMNRPNILKSGMRELFYYASLDLALTNDGACISVVHYEDDTNMSKIIPRKLHPSVEFMMDKVNDNSRFVVDYIWSFEPDKGDPIPVDLVVDVMKDVIKNFRIRKFSYDQWSAEMFRQWLLKEKFPIKLINVINATETFNSDSARLFMQLMNEGRLVFPDWDYLFYQINKLKEYIRGRKIKVENPTGKDDVFNSVSKSIFVCNSDPFRNKKFTGKSFNRMASDYNKRFIRNNIKKRNMKKIII